MTPPEAAPTREDVTQAMHDDPAFVAAWSKMEAKGYLYGDDALEHVYLGWKLARTARPDAGDEVERLRAALAAKPWPPTDEDLRKMLGHIVGAWWSKSTGDDLIKGKARLNPQDIKGMYAVRDALSPYVAALAAMREGVDRGMVEVPRKPTIEQLNAAVDATGAGSGMSWNGRSPQKLFAQGYAAMVDAAALSRKGG